AALHTALAQVSRCAWSSARNGSEWSVTKRRYILICFWYSATPNKVQALLFDTFGTIVDWRGSIIAEGAAWGKAKGITIDWSRFADRWRDGYRPAMAKVRN